MLPMPLPLWELSYGREGRFFAESVTRACACQSPLCAMAWRCINTALSLPPSRLNSNTPPRRAFLFLLQHTQRQRQRRRTLARRAMDGPGPSNVHRSSGVGAGNGGGGGVGLEGKVEGGSGGGERNTRFDPAAQHSIALHSSPSSHQRPQPSTPLAPPSTSPTAQPTSATEAEYAPAPSSTSPSFPTSYDFDDLQQYLAYEQFVTGGGGEQHSPASPSPLSWTDDVTTSTTSPLSPVLHHDREAPPRLFAARQRHDSDDTVTVSNFPIPTTTAPSSNTTRESHAQTQRQLQCPPSSTINPNANANCDSTSASIADNDCTVPVPGASSFSSAQDGPSRPPLNGARSGLSLGLMSVSGLSAGKLRRFSLCRSLLYSPKSPFKFPLPFSIHHFPVVQVSPSPLAGLSIPCVCDAHWQALSPSCPSVFLYSRDGLLT